METGDTRLAQRTHGSGLGAALIGRPSERAQTAAQAAGRPTAQRGAVRAAQLGQAAHRRARQARQCGARGLAAQGRSRPAAWPKRRGGRPVASAVGPVAQAAAQQPAHAARIQRGHVIMQKGPYAFLKLTISPACTICMSHVFSNQNPVLIIFSFLTFLFIFHE